MSNLPTVAVIVGAPAVPHLTLVKVAVVAVPDAGCLSSKVNDLPAVAVGMVNVQAVADVSVAVNTVPAVITIYEDRSFTFEIKLAPVSDMIKKVLGLEKGSGTAPKDMVGTLTQDQLTKIAEEKIRDLNTKDLEAAKRVVAGTARSMGVKIEN